eukprot:6440296-Prymnesium_polylepis.1
MCVSRPCGRSVDVLASVVSCVHAVPSEHRVSYCQLSACMQQPVSCCVCISSDVLPDGTLRCDVGGACSARVPRNEVHPKRGTDRWDREALLVLTWAGASVFMGEEAPAKAPADR